ncbi:hypothetical protein [Geobacter benzoatilyticus]|uniref:Uncharacterized protein n=1 Tax=Geobacter benzoatilyticus TaxID=2815309 RepID=A0ABX7Q1L5_9BACT|nr:hypothetical protein [Geobacter benzoatilyticus]QSV45006.1 hypothetical protein JZM60_12720 [Geobacter benzoatilyticus]
MSKKREKTVSNRPLETDYLKIVAETVNPETWKLIVDAAVQQAIDGDHEAREWLSTHLLKGAPALSGIPAAESGRELTEMLFGKA